MGLVSVLVFASTLHAAPGSNPIVAVFPIEDATAKLSAKALRSLGDYFGAKLAASGRYLVVARADIDSALKEKKAASYQACYDQSCQIEIGRELAAQKVCQLQIIQLGDRCGVSATVYDLKTGASDKGAVEKGGCTENELVDTLEKVAATLVAHPDSAPAPAPAAISAPPPAASGPTYTLRLTTIPADAEIAIDGHVVGNGSIEAPLAAGVDHSLTIRADGHVAHQSTVTLTEDTRRQIELPWTADAVATRGEVFNVSVAAFSTFGGTLGGVLWLSAPVVRGGGIAWTTFEGFAGMGVGPANLVGFRRTDSGPIVDFESGPGVLFGFDTRLGYRFALGSDASLEAGLGLGFMMMLGFNHWADQATSPMLAPILRYQSLPQGSTGWGIGVRLLAPFIGLCRPPESEGDIEDAAQCISSAPTMLQLEANLGVF